MEPEAQQAHLLARSVAQEIGGELPQRLEDEAAALFGGLDLTHCLQCGVCSGSCPTMARMAHGPRRIMHMLCLGMLDRVLRSDDIWFCVSCYSCSTRCPQSLEIADVMAALRGLAIVEGLAKDREATFSRVFVDVLERYGRLYEPEVLVRYYVSEGNVIPLLRQVGLGLRMLRKGKIALRPTSVQNVEQLQEIGARIRGERVL